MHTISLFQLEYLVLIALFAGWVDALAGSGGLLTLPALLSVGLPPALALGTNRLQGSVGELSAAVYFAKRGHINFKEIRGGFVFAAFGSVIGTFVIQIIHPDILRKIIPFLMLTILIYIVISPRIVKKEMHSPVLLRWFFPIAGFCFGFYNGFFGPGTGSLWVAAFMIVLGFNIQKATMYAKPLNFSTNVISFICFAIGGHVNYVIALSMAVGQWFGAQMGANVVVTRGQRWIRPVFLTVVAIMTARMFLENFFPDVPLRFVLG